MPLDKSKKTITRLKLPLRFAAIDLGSNSIKMRISEVTDPGETCNPL